MLKVMKYGSRAFAAMDAMNYFNTEAGAGVSGIIADVEKNGDAAVKKYTLKFDGVALTSLKVPEEKIKKAWGSVDARLFKPMLKAAKNIEKYHVMQMKNIRGFVYKNRGYTITHKYIPVDSAALYIPGGQAPLFSTVLMAAIPARVAGVRRIAVISPPRFNGDVNPYILVAADMLGINEIYRIGGAQAVAALSTGTKTIRKVDKIVGPGNIYSTMAKKEVFGKIGIESINGPSEVTIVADDTANPEFVKYDLLAQAEHINGHALLITNSEKFLSAMKIKLKGIKYDITAVLVKNLDEALKLVNYKAPEHLTVAVKDTGAFISGVRNCSAIFEGNYTPVAFGDYMAGSNHILPTNGTARFFSGLSVLDFLKHTHVVRATREAMDAFGPDAETLAEIETLIYHKKSIMARREL
jgi:histidinol dehydrogenase